MASFTQEKETEIVRDAMTLTAVIQIEEEELKKRKLDLYPETLPGFSSYFTERPPARPSRPAATRTIVKLNIPEPPKVEYTLKDQLKTHKPIYIALAVVCGLMVFFGGLLSSLLYIPYLLFAYIGLFASMSLFILFFRDLLQAPKVKKQLNEEAARSKEYLDLVENTKKQNREMQAKMDEETEKKQIELDNEYESRLHRFETVLLPEYNKKVKEKKEEYAELEREFKEEKRKWEVMTKNKIQCLEEDLEFNRGTLETLYESTRIISLTYRELWILQWLYDDMRTSDHDIRYATELLDRDRQRIATEEAGRRVSGAVSALSDDMKKGFLGIYQQVEEGNLELANLRSVLQEIEANTMEMAGTMYETQEEVGKARRHNDVANLVSIYQRYKYNKRR
ncbi:MAG: hypothetical protein IKE40_02865 [Firmicutes bacterium]|nr:hypothetical protein [Bacillota bacterium]